jgi:hypothetical protein
MATRRVSVNLTEEAIKSLEALAHKRGITMTEALRKAIATEKFLVDEVSEGSKVLIRSKDGKETRQLLIS